MSVSSGEREYLEVFLKCAICKGYVPYDSAMCQYCGSLIGYDQNAQQYYTWARVCFNCSFENKLGAEICKNCKQNLKIICPECGGEISLGNYCERCGLNDFNKRIIAMKRAKSAKMGLYVVAVIFLSMALFFLFLILKDQNADQGRMVKLVIGVVIFLGLFIAILKSSSGLKRERPKGPRS